ncbi:MAG TPA: DUF805 domain-containing protein [Bauldia sp.]|nr:DUF805 domain-containing protein [Bauldia sp.]
MRPASTEQILRFFFRANGRISRREYALGLIFLQAINAALLTIVLNAEELTPEQLLPIVVISLPLTIALAVIMAKRCHDIGLPGSFFLLALVPVVGLFWPIALAFLAGNPTANAYGPPPAFASE